MVIFGASDGVVPFLIKHVLDGIFANQDKGMLTLLPVVLVLFTILRAAADFGQEFLMSRVGHSIVRDMRNDINRHLLSLSSDYFIRHSSGAILSRITSDVLLVRALLTNSLASIIRDSIRIVALLVTAVYLDPFLALIAFVAFPLGLYPVFRFGKRLRRLSRKGQEAIGSLSSLIQETVVGNRVVKIFCREKYEIERFNEENERLNETFIKSERVRAISGPVNEILASFAISGVILYGGMTVISGVRSQGDFIAFLISVFLLYDPFKKLTRVNNVVQQGASGAERIFELLDTPPTITSPVNPVPLPTSNTIDFDKVRFRYAETGDWVLDEIQLHVPEGKKFALVGHSGAGKTTLADLIPRFLDPVEGSVKIGGVDIREVSLEELRSRITMVSQHTFLFNDTIYNNIAYGKPGATEAMVHEAARAAHAFSFIQDLPAGFNTVVGQDGLSLSGGERQRISIARALLKDSPILILDEATASLDNKSEREVQAALDRLQKDRTTIVIAHRLSTIRDADCIIVMDAGRIVEAGAHQELLDQGGAFARLYALQFAHQDLEGGGSPLVN
jgi:subfamily B ATP-binding cassette protein MsbA